MKGFLDVGILGLSNELQSAVEAIVDKVASGM